MVRAARVTTEGPADRIVVITVRVRETRNSVSAVARRAVTESSNGTVGDAMAGTVILSSGVVLDGSTTTGRAGSVTSGVTTSAEAIDVLSTGVTNAEAPTKGATSAGSVPRRAVPVGTGGRAPRSATTSRPASFSRLRSFPTP